MWVRSGTSARRIIAFSLLLALLASPCFAVGFLENLLGSRYRTEQSSQVSEPQPQLQLQEESKLASEESSQEAPQQPQGMSETELLEKLKELSRESEKVSTAYREQLTEVNGSLESLKAQLEDLKGVNQISDEQYNEVLTSLNQVVESNAQLADENQYMSGYVDGVKKAEKKTRFYANFGGVIGFKDSQPTWGVTGNFGVKMGKGFMIGTGASYMIGDFKTLPKLAFDINNLSMNLTVGWEW